MCDAARRLSPGGSAHSVCCWLRDAWSLLAPNDLLSVSAALPPGTQSCMRSEALGEAQWCAAPPPTRFAWRTRLNNEPLTPTHCGALLQEERQALATVQATPRERTRDLCTYRLGAAAFRTAPAGRTPVFKNLQSATSNLRASATIPSLRSRALPCPKRFSYQCVSALVG